MRTQLADRIPNPEAPIPPLPDPLPIPETELPLPRLPQPELPRPWPPEPWPPIRLRSVRPGCYLLSLTMSASPTVVYDGTLRVESNAGGRTASGDLYQRKLVRICTPPRPMIPSRCFLIPGPGPSPADGIPVFARDRYRYYLRVTQILESYTLANSFTLGFEMHRFDGTTKAWTNEGAFTAVMVWTTAPTGYPAPGSYLEGDLTNGAGVVVGRLTMGWVSTYLRRAVVEIDTASASEAPVESGTGVTWRTIFDQVGWDVNAVVSNRTVPEPSGESWSDAELHQAMLAWRDSADLDSEWRYHLLCVRRLDSTSRGLMYDAYGGDTNNVPREGAAESSHWRFTSDPVFPESYPWGACASLRFGESAAAYFRTAVHEISHAIMLFHPSSTTGNHIMQVTPQIAANAVPPVQFPDNIDWAFSPEDQRRLRHLPDVVVRPGTVLRFGQDVMPSYSGIPLSPLDVTAEIEGLELQVSPVLEAVPIGAPVRVSFALVNKGCESVPVPSRLSLKSGHVTGAVVGPSGATRTYSTIVRYLDEAKPEMLEPKMSVGDSLTLLRGPEGALFPSSGLHRVVVTLSWDAAGTPVRLTGETHVMVTPAVDDAHAKAALRILTTPDALVTLAVGGDHVPEGIAAIQAGIENPVLRPHFAYVESKRLAQRFGTRKPDLKSAAALLTDQTVMSPAEVKKAATILKSGGGDGVAGESIAKVLKAKAIELGVSDDVKAVVSAL